ncbi:N,N-dimethylformamidase beta subunit family domain-containing protein [Lignipirellula cremea]|uniref:N,N-dimethylformamidase beta subunit n=1 Tax=Lignipirellula cremea TaxID=2528010 RepID=A0A518DNB2_9BACT|nr:N,N-dimethylformamidase beta subunit family domain-containing protein [Lignipirellula cremea]QDU93325.1 N,N-dimethylformamidase beta subunit [Lignipirellula cremea]
MLVGYVSDERYLAIADVLLEFTTAAGPVVARSTATGAVYADLPPGEYPVALVKTGYGAKRTTAAIAEGVPFLFRLLSDGLLGYAWPKWVRSGESSEFRVHADEAYQLSLWRYGLRKELVRPLGWFDEHGPRATVQITPDGDYTQTGVRWNHFGYASPHHKQYVAAPEASGLYYFHAETESGRFFSFPWIVAPSRPQAKIAVLASNISWNAYNNFGGRSNYIHPDQLPPTPTLNARQELKRYTDAQFSQYACRDYAPLSFERPEPICHIPQQTQATDPIAGRAACHLAPAEWRLLAWLEREKFAYDYYAETQLHFDALPLDDYQVLVLSTHPEYWSQKMYDAVKRWVQERGGRLVYLGGNGLNCDVEFLDEQTCIYRNEDERADSPAGRPYESRFHRRHESEANLLGVAYSPLGIMTAAPYQVIEDGHWVFAGTGLRRGDLFGRRSLHERIPGGASGHETDKITDSSPPNVRLLAQGMNPDQGGAQMILYPTDQGAVFSVGSICWPSSLLVDEAVSIITANVLHRFLEPRSGSLA